MYVVCFMINYSFAEDSRLCFVLYCCNLHDYIKVLTMFYADRDYLCSLYVQCCLAFRTNVIIMHYTATKFL